MGLLDNPALSLSDITMRTIVDLPEDQINALDRYRVKKRISRAEAVRRAVAAFLPKQQEPGVDWTKYPAFGSSRKQQRDDSREFVASLRSEWK